MFVGELCKPCHAVQEARKAEQKPLARVHKPKRTITLEGSAAILATRKF